MNNVNWFTIKKIGRKHEAFAPVAFLSTFFQLVSAFEHVLIEHFN